MLTAKWDGFNNKAKHQLSWPASKIMPKSSIEQKSGGEHRFNLTKNKFSNKKETRGRTHCFSVMQKRYRDGDGEYDKEVVKKPPLIRG